MCDCKEKIILHKPEKAFEAIEEWCPIHGYMNDCWICHLSDEEFYASTELCIKHRDYTIKACFNCISAKVNKIAGCWTCNHPNKNGMLVNGNAVCRYFKEKLNDPKITKRP